MNGNSVRAYCAQPLHFLAVISMTLLLFAACDQTPGEASAPVISALAVPSGMEVVYGPVNKSNPFEHVGMRHNDLVHAVIVSAEPWDTLSIPTMFSHIQKSAVEWSGIAMDIPSERAILHVKTAFAMKLDSSARHQLAEFDAPGYSAREIRYIRRIGILFCESTTFTDLEQGLLGIERDVLAEQWPAGNSVEISARIAISVAKHSCAYWKRMFFVAAGVDPSAISKFSAAGSSTTLAKPSELRLHLLTKLEMVAAADVMAATSAAEAVAALGPLRQIEAAIVSGGAVSLVVAALLYFENFVGFLRSVCL